MLFLLIPTKITLCIHTSILNVYIDHTYEEIDERVLDDPIEVPETPNHFPNPILVQLPNNYL